MTLRDPMNSAYTNLPAVEEHLIPTREEHRLLIRRIWKWCIGGASGIFVVTGGIVLALFVAGHDPKRIVEVSTSIFQVLVLTYGMGFFVPAFMTSLLKMSLGVDMSRKGLEIGKQTAEALRDFQRETRPLLKDFKEVVGAVKEVVEDLRKQEVGGIVSFLDKIGRDGTVDRIAVSLEEIGKKFQEVYDKAKKDVVSREIDKL